MMNTIKDKLKKGSAYIFIVGVTIGLLLAAELSGFSKAFAEAENKAQRQKLVYMLNKPEYATKNARFTMGGNKKDIQRNIEYLDRYEGLRDKSTRHGANAFALLFGLSGASCTVAGKRKLDELLFK